MICQNCNENEANVKYTEIINGEKREMMLCEECSHELGLDNVNFNMPIDFSSFFGGLLESEKYNEHEFMPLFQNIKELKCEKCNMTYDEFVEQGKFGCEECYNVFSNKIDTILKRFHGDNKHLGRKSVGAGHTSLQKEKNVGATISRSQSKNTEDNMLNELQKELKKAISDERYEDAAKIRDQIKNLKIED